MDALLSPHSTITTPMLGGLALPSSTATLPATLPLVPVVPSDREDSFLLIHLDAQVHALPLSAVHEILPLQTVLAIPGATTACLGLIEVRERSVMLLSLRRLLRLPELSSESEGFVVLVDNGKGERVGLRVDGVSRIVVVPAEGIEPIEALGTEGPVAVLHLTEGTTPLLSPRRLLSGLPLLRVASGVDESEPEAGVTVVRRAVSYHIAGVEYATPIDNLCEIVPLPAERLSLPLGKQSHCGMLFLRGQLLPFVNLSERLGLSATEGSQVLVMQHPSNGLLGLLVDAVGEVLSIPSEQVQALPVQQHELGWCFAGGLCQAVEGRQIEWLEAAGIAALAGLPAPEQRLTASPPSQRKSLACKQVVVFQIGDTNYGIEASQLQEIRAVPQDMRRFAGMSSELEGMTELRGQPLKVTALRRLLGLPVADVDALQRVLVLRDRDDLRGYIVDSVEAIREIALDTIKPAPLHTGTSVVAPQVAGPDEAGKLLQLIDTACLLKGQQCERATL